MPAVVARIQQDHADALEAAWDRATAPHRLLVARCSWVALRVLARLEVLLPQCRITAAADQLGEAWGGLAGEVSQLRAVALQLRLLARNAAVAAGAGLFPWA